MAKQDYPTSRTTGLKKWPKGKSGNPKGRPPMPEILRTKFEDFAEEGAETLFDLIRNSPNDMVRIKGIEMIASYIMPKATQKIEIDHQVTHNMSDLIAKMNASLTHVEQATIIEVIPEQTAAITHNPAGKPN